MTLSYGEALLVASGAVTVESSSRAPSRRVGKQPKEEK
jgi:hypothetical protein